MVVKVHIVNRVCSWILWYTSLCLFYICIYIHMCIHIHIYTIYRLVYFGNLKMALSVVRFNWIFLFGFRLCCFVITENNSKKKTSVTFPPFFEHSSWSPVNSLTLFKFNYDLRIWLVLSRQVLFCSLLFSWCVRICLASYLVDCITSDLVILVCVFPGKGGCCRTFSKLVFCCLSPSSHHSAHLGE